MFSLEYFIYYMGSLDFVFGTYSVALDGCVLSSIMFCCLAGILIRNFCFGMPGFSMGQYIELFITNLS